MSTQTLEASTEPVVVDVRTADGGTDHKTDQNQQQMQCFREMPARQFDAQEC